MIYSEKELSKVEEVLEDDKICNHLSKIDEVLEGLELPSATEMIEDCIRNYRKKSMYISRAIFTKNGEKVDTGVAIEIENNDGDGYSVYCSSIIRDEKMPVSIVNSLLDLSYSGYQLKTSKTTDVVEIKLKGDEFKCW